MNKNQRRKIENKIALVNHLGGRCQKCGYHHSLSALHFHHRKPKNKSFKLADRRSLSIDKLLKEVKKCDLLCANCHAEQHESKDAKKLFTANKRKRLISRKVAMEDAYA